MPNKRSNRRKKNKSKPNRSCKTVEKSVADLEKIIQKLHIDGACKEIRKFLAYIAEREIYGPDRSKEFVVFCLSSYFLLRHRYEPFYFVHNMLPLEIMEEQLFDDYDFDAGINDQRIALIKIKTEHNLPKSQIALLFMDETSVKPDLSVSNGSRLKICVNNGKTKDESKLAKYVTIIWLQSVEGSWLVPVGYIFTENSATVSDIKDFLFECVIKLTGIGIKIAGVVTKMRPNFYAFAKELNISATNQTFNVQDQEILYLFDVPQLMNVTRNMFMKHKLKFDDMEATWKTVKAFYQLEKENLTEKRTKLTDGHLKPDMQMRIIPKFAIELMSNSVATEMNSYIFQEKLPTSATGTAEFIDLMDKLFDMLNSRKEISINEFNCGFKGTKHQVRFMEKMINFFENLKVYDSKEEDRTNDVKFITGWLVTIKSVMKLWNIVKVHGYPCLMTANINYDFVDTFFTILRVSLLDLLEPTSSSFLEIFKQFFTVAYFLPTASNPLKVGPEPEFNLESYCRKIYKRIPKLQNNFDDQLNEAPEDCSVFSDMFDEFIENYFFILQ